MNTLTQQYNDDMAKQQKWVDALIKESHKTLQDQLEAYEGKNFKKSITLENNYKNKLQKMQSSIDMQKKRETVL